MRYFYIEKVNCLEGVSKDIYKRRIRNNKFEELGI